MERLCGLSWVVCDCVHVSMCVLSFWVERNPLPACGCLFLPTHLPTSLEVNPASSWWFSLTSAPSSFLSRSNSLTRLLPWFKSIDLNKPIDKRIYKGTQPTCHDFNQFTAATETISLLVGFSAGQVQYLDLIKKDTSKLFNEEVIEDLNCSFLIIYPALNCLEIE